MADGWRKKSERTSDAYKAKKYVKLSKQYANVQKKLYKGLSAKDIQKGKRANIKESILFGGLSAALAETYRLKKVNDMIYGGNPRHSRK